MFENTDSSDDNDDILSKQALPAADDSHGPVDLNKMPTTGEEYLRQVRYQASQLPVFQTASIPDKHQKKSSASKKHAWHKLFSSTDPVQNVDAKHLVSIDWQKEQCNEFSNVRNDFFKMRDRLRTNSKSNFRATRLRSANNYWTLCFGNDIPFQSSLSLDDQLNEQSSLPTMTKMISLSQAQLHELLQHEIDWLKTCGCSLHLALHVYATLVAIEKPISEDVMYTMRQTCLVWKQTRTKLLIPSDNTSPADDSLIKACDLFVCIVGRYFGQFDMADTTD